MGSHFDVAPFKVLILGGSYGGLSAALNLIDLAEGRAARQGNGVVPGHDGKVPVDITIVDERDGFCTWWSSFSPSFSFLFSLPQSNTQN